MGYRMSFGCTCEEGHFFLELDEGFASAVWSDGRGVLRELGLATVPELAGEDVAEVEEVELEPAAFASWLETLAERREAILEALRARGADPAFRRAWQAREFEEELRCFRELARHAAEEGVAIDAGWA